MTDEQFEAASNSAAHASNMAAVYAAKGNAGLLAEVKSTMTDEQFEAASKAAAAMGKQSKDRALYAAAKSNGPDAEEALKAELGKAFDSAKAGVDAGVRNLVTASHARSSDMVVELTIKVTATQNTIKVNITKSYKLILTYGHIRKLFGGPGKCTLGATGNIEATIGEGKEPGSKAKKTEVWSSRGTLVDTAHGKQTRWKPTENSKCAHSGTMSYAQVVRELGLEVTQRYGPRNKAGS